MDPNKTLANIRAIVIEMNRGCTDGEYASLADELSWMIRDLDKWISTGGFLPAEWTHRDRVTV
jgi:hypothetical protein